MNKIVTQKSENLVCPVSKAMNLVKGRWVFPIVHTLMSGTKRFKELERSVEGINTRMLVKELKNLEATGVVTRRCYATVPPTVEYSLTAKGLAIEPILNEIERWAIKHL